MFITGDPLADFDRYDAEQQSKLEECPECCCCCEHIQDEYLFDFDGDLVCDECLHDYVNEKYRKPTERYID